MTVSHNYPGNPRFLTKPVQNPTHPSTENLAGCKTSACSRFFTGELLSFEKITRIVSSIFTIVSYVFSTRNCSSQTLVDHAIQDVNNPDTKLLSALSDIGVDIIQAKALCKDDLGRSYHSSSATVLDKAVGAKSPALLRALLSYMDQGELASQRDSLVAKVRYKIQFMESGESFNDWKGVAEKLLGEGADPTELKGKLLDTVMSRLSLTSLPHPINSWKGVAEQLLEEGADPGGNTNLFRLVTAVFFAGLDMSNAQRYLSNEEKKERVTYFRELFMTFLRHGVDLQIPDGNQTVIGLLKQNLEKAKTDNSLSINDEMRKFLIEEMETLLKQIDEFQSEQPS